MSSNKLFCSLVLCVIVLLVVDYASAGSMEKGKDVIMKKESSSGHPEIVLEKAKEKKDDYSWLFHDSEGDRRRNRRRKRSDYEPCHGGDEGDGFRRRKRRDADEPCHHDGFGDY